MNSETMGTLFVLGIATLIAIILIAIISGVFSTARTKTTADAVIAQDGAYRKLAAEATAAQQAIAEQHERIAADLADLRERVASMEKLLREVG